MFNVELVVTLLISLIVGYLSITVPLLVKLFELEKPARKKSPIGKIIFAETSICILLAMIVWDLYLSNPVDPFNFIVSQICTAVESFIGLFNFIFVQIYTVVGNVVKGVWSFFLNMLVPFYGYLFQKMNFKIVYWVGYAELVIPISIIICKKKPAKKLSNEKDEQSSEDKVNSVTMSGVIKKLVIVVFVWIVLSWVNYLICFGMYRALIEFSICHVLITSGLFNVVIDIIVLATN